MTQQNWRTETNATDYLTNQKKQLVVADRRPVIRRASDLVGPGIASGAIRITDFADPLALFNGFFSALHTALDRPPVEQSYVGYVSSDLELGGVRCSSVSPTGFAIPASSTAVCSTPMTSRGARGL